MIATIAQLCDEARLWDDSNGRLGRPLGDREVRRLADEILRLRDRVAVFDRDGGQKDEAMSLGWVNGDRELSPPVPQRSRIEVCRIALTAALRVVNETTNTTTYGLVRDALKACGPVPQSRATTNERNGDG